MVRAVHRIVARRAPEKCTIASATRGVAAAGAAAASTSPAASAAAGLCVSTPPPPPPASSPPPSSSGVWRVATPSRVRCERRTAFGSHIRLCGEGERSVPRHVFWMTPIIMITPRGTTQTPRGRARRPGRDARAPCSRCAAINTNMAQLESDHRVSVININIDMTQ